MAICFLDPNRLSQIIKTVNCDPEFQLAARFMSENFLLSTGDTQCIIKIRDGLLTEIELNPLSVTWHFSIRATTGFWEKFLTPVPPPFYNSLYAGMSRGMVAVEGELQTAYAYFWAVTRLLDIMRELQNEPETWSK